MRTSEQKDFCKKVFLKLLNEVECLNYPESLKFALIRRCMEQARQITRQYSEWEDTLWP